MTTVIPGTDNPCMKRHSPIHSISGLWAVSAVGKVKNNKAPTTNDLRPTASESMPKNGDIIAMANMVAPTIMPACTSVAINSTINTGKIAWIEYTCKKANTPIKPMVSFKIKDGGLKGVIELFIDKRVFLFLFTKMLTMLNALNMGVVG